MLNTKEQGVESGVSQKAGATTATRVQQCKARHQKLTLPTLPFRALLSLQSRNKGREHGRGIASSSTVKLRSQVATKLFKACPSAFCALFLNQVEVNPVQESTYRAENKQIQPEQPGIQSHLFNFVSSSAFTDPDSGFVAPFQPRLQLPTSWLNRRPSKVLFLPPEALTLSILDQLVSCCSVITTLL